MTKLSPATQSVLDAIKQKWTANDDTFIREFSATVIRSAADNLVFSDQLGLTVYGSFSQLRDQLNEIADELDRFNGRTLSQYPSRLNDSPELRWILAVPAPQCWPLAADARPATGPAMANATRQQYQDIETIRDALNRLPPDI